MKAWLEWMEAIQERCGGQSRKVRGQDGGISRQAKTEAYLEKAQTNQEKIEASQGKMEAILEHYKWVAHVKTMHLLTTPQGRASSILHEVLKE